MNNKQATPRPCNTYWIQAEDSSHLDVSCHAAYKHTLQHSFPAQLVCCCPCYATAAADLGEDLSINAQPLAHSQGLRHCSHRGSNHQGIAQPRNETCMCMSENTQDYVCVHAQLGVNHAYATAFASWHAVQFMQRAAASRPDLQRIEKWDVWYVFIAFAEAASITWLISSHQ